MRRGELEGRTIAVKPNTDKVVGSSCARNKGAQRIKFENYSPNGARDTHTGSMDKRIIPEL
jgi:hypothetical protein